MVRRSDDPLLLLSPRRRRSANLSQEFARGGSYPGSVPEPNGHCDEQCSPAASGERLVSAWQRAHPRDFSTTLSVASAPSFAARNDSSQQYVNAFDKNQSRKGNY